MGFNHPLIFLLCSHQTKQWPTHGHTLFYATIPKKFVCKFIVGDVFICGENFEVQLFNFHPDLKQKLKAIGA